MKLYPAAAPETLGFEPVRQRLESHTLSRLGEARLRHMRPFERLDEAREELARVSQFADALRFDDPVPLEHVLDVREVTRRLAPQEAFVAPEDLLALRLTLATLRRVRAYFETRRAKYPAVCGLAGRIAPLPGVEEAIARAVDDEGRLRDDASPELRRLRRLLLQRQGQLREMLQQELRRAIGQGFATEDQPTLRNGRMVIPVRAEAKRKVQGFVQDISATGQTVYIEPSSCLDLNNEIREIESEERREIERILRAVAAAVRERLAEVQENIRILGALDLLQAKARLAAELEASVPQLNDEGILDIRKGRNPGLLLRFRRIRQETGEERRVVPLDLRLGADASTLIITGPNAGGKTVAMKTVGLFALMLAYGLPIPADPLSNCCLFRRLMIDIGDQQSQEEDLSTFSSHIARMKYMVSQAAPDVLILIDEAGTGTDPAEGGALAQAVFERLTAAGARTIATTHHGTLKVFAHETPGVENGSMQFDQETLSPTYRFQQGIPGSSYAFEIAQRGGLHRDVLRRARALVGRQKTSLEELITAFQARTQALEQQLAEAGRREEEAAAERRRYEQRAETLARRTDEITQKAVEEAERIVAAANARIERTVREIREAQADRDQTREARERLTELRETLEQKRRDLETRRPAARKPARTARPAPAAPPAADIRAGDLVVVDDGKTPAEVLEISGGEAYVAIGAARMRVRLNRLQRVGGPKKQVVTYRRVGADGAAALGALGAQRAVDLRGRRADEAVAEVERLIDAAILANLDTVEVLHGKGTGALRQAIHEYLTRSPDVASFEEAPIEQGGAGVTHVHLK